MFTHPALTLVNSSLNNLDSYKDTDVKDQSPIMTQWVLSFTGILTLAFEPLLEPSALKEVKVGDPEYLRLGFPTLDWVMRRSEHPCDFPNFFRLLRFLRNGLAHGNTEFVPGPWYLGRRGEVVRHLLNSSFGGLAVWNTQDGVSTPSMILDFRDIQDFVKALGTLCNEKQYWRTSALDWSGEKILEKYGW